MHEVRNKGSSTSPPYSKPGGDDDKGETADEGKRMTKDLDEITDILKV